MLARLFVPLIALTVTASIPAWFSARRDSQACEGPIPIHTVDPVVSPLVYAGGTVVMRVLVGSDGAVQTIEVITPVPALVEPAQMALRQWRFIPAMCANEPVDAWTNVTFHIVLIRNVVGSESAGYPTRSSQTLR